MTLYEHTLSTEKEGLYDITDKVAGAVARSGVTEGLCVVYCAHTTAAVTVNENADPDVAADLLAGLDAAFPNRDFFRHREGNSAAHLKSSCVGASQTLVVHMGKLLLGTWQGVYFCEFDGPRKRRFYVKIVAG